MLISHQWTTGYKNYINVVRWWVNSTFHDESTWSFSSCLSLCVRVRVCVHARVYVCVCVCVCQLHRRMGWEQCWQYWKTDWAYAARTLSPAEKNYSQLEKEWLAFVFGVKRLHLYLLGHRFSLVTDHKPLLALFNEHWSTFPQASAWIEDGGCCWQHTAIHLSSTKLKLTVTWMH